MANSYTTDMADPRLNIIQDTAPAQNLNRIADLKQNCAQVRREFVGKPEVCHELVTHIIHLRRGIDVQQHIQAFGAILQNYLPTLLEHLDVRWLISILDTLADYGTPDIAGRALTVVVLINNTNIHQTILDAAGGKFTQPAPKRPSWGGMLTVDTRTGDMIVNMMQRVDNLVKPDPIISQIWQRIKQLGADSDVVMNTLCSWHSNPEWRTFFR